VLSALGWSPRPEAVAVFSALAPWADTTTAPAAAVATTSTQTASAQTASTPALTNGVTGVKVGHSDLEIPCGPNGYTAPADWYFPTQADGTVKANGVIWLQHGFLADKAFYSALATTLAQQTGSIVVAPTLTSFPLACAGCWLNGVPMQQAVAQMFVDPSRTQLNISANAAGYTGVLPEQFVLTGHSAGGGLAVAAGGYYADAVPADKNHLLGVVMFDGVSSNGTFAGAIQSLSGIPVYQIAAPPQAFNAFGGTTDELIAGRPGQFVGDVLVGGSHVDSMLGSNPIIDFAAQLVTKFSPAGNTAAVYTLATGWINDMYTPGAGPDNPQYGFYGTAGQLIILGDAAAIVLPAQQASQLSPLEQMLEAWTAAVTPILFGGPSTAAVGATPAQAVPTPALTNGVTGVKTGHSDLYIPVGSDSYTAPADWYFPTQADGTVQAQGVIYLQHGFLGFKSWYSALATQLAQQTNSVVVAPNLPWFDLPWNCSGCYLSGVPMQQAVAGLFADPDRAWLNISANQAGYLGTLPEDFVLTGHSAGGGLAAAAGGFYTDAVPANQNHLLGVVMFDGVSSNGTFAGALASLDTLGIPVYQIAAPPQPWNADGQTTDELVALRPGQFVGDVLANGSHVDSLIGGVPIIDFISQLVIKRSPPGNTAAVYTLATGWINDMYAGLGPTNGNGIYGDPDQFIVMGQTAAVVLGPPPVVDVNKYLGTWYEVGSVKQFFSIGLVNTKAVYSLNPNGSIKVENSGNYFFNNGPESSIVGSAVSVDPDNNKLNVSFLGPASATPPGNYWIVDLAPDYSWAIVSDSTGSTGFLLTRDQTISDELYQELLDRASAKGVNGCITPTRQPSAALAAVSV
jgi:lipocalin/acetyl esterase/lipase